MSPKRQNTNLQAIAAEPQWTAIRLQAKPQGAVFSGKIEPLSDDRLVAEYYAPESGRLFMEITFLDPPVRKAWFELRPVSADEAAA